MKGKEFVSRYLTHNLGLKLASLAIAFILWIIFTNSEDPMQTYMANVDVEVLHQDEFEKEQRFIMVNGTDDLSTLNLNVYLRARSSVVKSLSTRDPSSYMRAYIDLYEISDEDPDRLIIHYEFTDRTVNADFYSYRNRTYYSIQVEDTVSVEVPVQYAISGSPASGYIYMSTDPDIAVTPKTITISGPETKVNSVSYAYISVNLNGAYANVSKIGNLVLKDASGATVSNADGQMTLSSTEASVFVPIYAYKAVTVQPHLTGTVQDGYEYANDIAVSSASISIYGQESVINKISTLSLPEIDVSQVTGAFSQTFDVQDVLNETYGENEVHLMSSSPTTVTVTFTVEKQVEKTITVNTSDIIVTGLGGAYTCAFDAKTLDITVYGLPSAVDLYTGENMVVMLRFKSTDLTEGKHTIAVDVTGTGELKVRQAYVSVTLTPVESTASSSS